MGKLGILGGMGPMATQLLYKMIIENTDAKKDQEHLDMIILNHASMPDRTEAINSGKTEEIFKLLSDDIKMLSENGCNVIAIPCNTSHYLYDRLNDSTDSIVINMIRQSAEDLKSLRKNAKKIGILATDGTLKANLYRKECEAVGFEAIYPEPEIQKIVMDIIYNQIKRGETGNPEDFEKIDRHLKSVGCDGAILACTELSCFRDFNPLPDFYVDALESLCKKAILLSGGKLK